MAKFEDLIERVREVDEDLADELEEFKGSSLREKAKQADEAIARAEAAEKRVAELESAPKRREAFEKYGIDFDSLRKAERDLLEKYDGEITDEAIAEFVEQNELPVIESDGGETTEESDAEKIAGTAQRAGANGSRTPKVTPTDVSGWAADRWVRFAEANPDAAEALRRGETVTGVTG